MEAIVGVGRQKQAPTAIGRNIQRLRKMAGEGKKPLSQASLADKVGVHRQTIAQLETTSAFNPSLELLQKLAGALGCRVVDLVAEVPTIPPSA